MDQAGSCHDCGSHLSVASSTASYTVRLCCDVVSVVDTMRLCCGVVSIVDTVRLTGVCL